MIHELKTNMSYLHLTKSCRKTAEVRKNDRDFKQGDILILRGYEKEQFRDAYRSAGTMFDVDGYSPDCLVVTVFSVVSLPGMLKDGYVLLSHSQPTYCRGIESAMQTAACMNGEWF